MSEKHGKWIIDLDAVEDRHVWWAPILRRTDVRTVPHPDDSDRRLVVRVENHLERCPADAPVVGSYACPGGVRPTFVSREDCEAWIRRHDVADFFFPWAHIRVAAPGATTPSFADNGYLSPLAPQEEE